MSGDELFDRSHVEECQVSHRGVNVGMIPLLLCSNTVDGFLDRLVDMKHLEADKYIFRIIHLLVL